MTSPTRIITHTDFDGVCSAVILRAVLGPLPIIFAEPWTIEDGTCRVLSSDAVIDLPLPRSGCALWFDHHPTGGDPAGDPAYHLDATQPSCAGYLYRTYASTHNLQRFAPLIRDVDKIDSARFTPEDIRHPGPANRISITIQRDPAEDPYRRILVEALAACSVEEVAELPQVRERWSRYERAYAANLAATEAVLTTRGDVLLVDYTGLPGEPPETTPFDLFLHHETAQYAIRAKRDGDADRVKISVSGNPFTRPTRVHLGTLVKRYGGGGHQGAGGCGIAASEKDRVLAEMLAALLDGQV